MADSSTPVEVFYSYAHEDEAFRNTLEKHLSILRRQGLIKAWHDRHILPGTDWAQAIDEHLEGASMILLLVSSDFMASDYCYSPEMMRALQRQVEGKARVIPIILRPVDWRDTPLDKLQALPTDARPVKSWLDLDEALFNIVGGLRKVIKQGSLLLKCWW